MTDTIESLRQRVAELEEDKRKRDEWLSNGIYFTEAELAALKAGQDSPNYSLGEPVAWLELGEDELGRPEPVAAHINEPNIGNHRKVPLYTSAPSIPDGWKLVPVEPTVEMYEDGVYAYELTGFMSRAYEAMLSAAPEYKPQ